MNTFTSSGTPAASSVRSRMKVGSAMGLGFAVVIALGALMAIVAWVQFSRAHEEARMLVEDRMVKVVRLNQLMDNLNSQAIAVRDIVLMEDMAEMQAEKQRIDALRGRAVELIKVLDETISLPEAKAIFQRVKGVGWAYVGQLDEAMVLGLAKQTREARAILVGPAHKAHQQSIAVLEEAVAFQQKAMEAGAIKIEAIANTTSQLMLLIALLSTVLGTLVAVFLTRSITRQLGGEPSYASDIAHEIAEGNLAVEVRVRPGDTTSVLATMRMMRDSLTQVVARVRQGSESVATASAEIAQGNHDLSGRTESQASALQQTAASMEQLGSTVRQNADNARTANQLAQSASSVAVQGGEVVAQVVQTMDGISASSKKIADIISVIDGIAFQTNILALNAAVEAARAGEQGRGFAVVAGEVRNLAGRSAEAAKEIKDLITDSVVRVDQGSALVHQAGQTIQEVVNSVRRVTDIMGEISAASSEQSTGVAQVGEAVTQMDQATQQNAALVEEMSAAATSLNQQAQDLVHAVAVFRLQAGAGGLTETRAPAPSRPVAPARAPAPAKRAQPVSAARAAPASAPAIAPPPPARKAAAGSDDDWESF